MKYLWAFFGSFLYNLAIFVVAKNNCDKAEVDFPYRKYFKYNWDNWLLTIFVAVPLVWFMPDILKLINDKLGYGVPESPVIYLASGPLSELLIFFILKWSPRGKSEIVPPIHKE